jgi:hypothetical protein
VGRNSVCGVGGGREQEVAGQRRGASTEQPAPSAQMQPSYCTPRGRAAASPTSPAPPPAGGRGRERRTDPREPGHPGDAAAEQLMASSAHDARGWGITRRPRDVIASASRPWVCVLSRCRAFFAGAFLREGFFGRFVGAIVL